MERKGSCGRGEEGGLYLLCFDGVPSGGRSEMLKGRGRAEVGSGREDSLMLARDELRLCAAIALRRGLPFMLSSLAEAMEEVLPFGGAWIG